jgi:hypothetical protein
MNHARSPSRAPRSAAPATGGRAPAAESGGGGRGNAFFASLLQDAAKQAKGDGALVGFDEAFGVSVDPGKYHFPEDRTGTTAPATGERKTVDGLPALRDQHATSPWEDTKNGVAFAQGAGDSHAVSPNDVAQGSLGDCYLIAGMLAVARADPSLIEKLIKDNKDGTFAVTLYIRRNAYERPRPVTKTVDARLAVKTAGGSPLYAKTGDNTAEGTEMWPALLEKTLATHKGSYEQISGGNIATGFEFHGATELFTGKLENYYPTDRMDEDDILLTMAVALESKKPITVDSKAMDGQEDLTREANKWNVYGNHAYCPENVDLDGRTVDLTNPWGSSHVAKLPVADFKRFYRAIRIGGN